MTISIGYKTMSDIALKEPQIEYPLFFESEEAFVDFTRARCGEIKHQHSIIFQ
jgi:hypothetical protein